METNDLLKSTITDESRKQKGDTKTCLFCGLSHYFRSVRSRDHLGVGNGSKKMYRCNPYPEHIECHVQVVKEVNQRNEHDKIQVREVVKRSLESVQSDDVIDVEKFVEKTFLHQSVERTTSGPNLMVSGKPH